MKYLKTFESNKEKKPYIVYHGGDCDNLKSLYENFNVLSPDEKMKFPSSGAGKIGLSTSYDKSIAKKYSSAFGCKYVLVISVDQNSNFLYVDTKGQGIDEIYFNDELEELTKDYDAIMETDDDAEKEIRILNADKFKPIRIEI